MIIYINIVKRDYDGGETPLVFYYSSRLPTGRPFRRRRDRVASRDAAANSRLDVVVLGALV